MADKAKFAYGSLANLDAAVSAGKIDEFDLLCLVDEGVARIGWLDRNKKPVLVDTEPRVVAVDALPEAGEPGIIYIVGEIVYIYAGGKFIAISESTDLTALKEHVTVFEEKVSTIEEKVSSLETEIETKVDADEVDEKINQAKSDVVATANAYTDEKVEKAFGKCLTEKYEVVKAPDGTLVDYNDKEIRIMVPADTDWNTQENASSTGAENMFYIEIRAYAPEGATGFRDSDSNIADDAPIYGFDYTYAGTDEFGRNYIVLYQPVAHYDSESNAWGYYGVNSTTAHYIGWTYQVEWYDADSNMFAYDTVRINLSNEDCHFEVKPYYMGEIEAEIKSYTEELIDAKIEEISEIPVVEF